MTPLVKKLVGGVARSSIVNNSADVDHHHVGLTC